MRSARQTLNAKFTEAKDNGLTPKFRAKLTIGSDNYFVNPISKAIEHTSATGLFPQGLGCRLRHADNVSSNSHKVLFWNLSGFKSFCTKHCTILSEICNFDFIFLWKHGSQTTYLCRIYLISIVISLLLCKLAVALQVALFHSLSNNLAIL